MPRPGVTVSVLELPTPVSVPTDTGTWFAAGTTDRGPVVATLIQSLDQFNTVFGARQTYSVLYDAVETFFREGGNRVYIGRVCGPAATSGSKNLLDSGAGISLVVNAIGPGAWSSSYKVGVVAGVAGGSYQIQVTDVSNNVLEQSSDLLDQPSAVYWSQYSNYVRIVLGVTALNPALAAPVALSAGNDDRASITDTQWANALATFYAGLGPGQVSAPGRTTSVAYGQIKTHVEANSRVGLLDLPDSATVATLTAAAAQVSSRFCAAYGPWAVIPGLVAGSTRTAPPCSMIAGLIARNDPVLGTNTPSAGINGMTRYVTDVSQPNWDDPSRATLNNASCNLIRRMYGGIRVYGWRALVNPTSDAGWLDFGNARLYIALTSELNAAGENYVFAQIDGQAGVTISSFNDALVGILMEHYTNGELFGNAPGEAFAVDTGPSVNTLTTLSNLELHGICRVKMSPFAEWVSIQIVKRQITQVL